MDTYMPMSTTTRHNRISGGLIGNIFDFLRRHEAHALSEECALVYMGTKNEPMGFNLINVREIDDAESFRENTMPYLETVQPDFMFFKDNPYIENKRQTRTAGCPDLIVEIWSENNSRREKTFKMNLYATSPTTEHWYIEQDSNEVICYLGENKISDQNLGDILKTQSGLKFDLRYLEI